MSTIDEYREAKNTYLRLQNQAKKELMARFRQLEAEMAQIQRELREDFGVKVNPNLKSTVKRAKPASTAAPEPPAKQSPKIAAIEKKLATQKRKLEEAVQGGKPEKPIRDRIYELEDELRLAKEE